MKNWYLPLMKRYFWTAVLESLLLSFGVSVILDFSLWASLVGLLALFLALPVILDFFANRPYRPLDKCFAGDTKQKVRAILWQEQTKCGCVLYALAQSLFVACYDFKPRIDFELPYEQIASCTMVSADRMRLVCRDRSEYDFTSTDAAALAELARSLSSQNQLA
jgi:hypothetical protein